MRGDVTLRAQSLWRYLHRCDTLLQHYNVQSRIHPLRSIKLPCGTPIYVKRDDELGFGVTGTKKRKYSSLLRHFVRQAYTDAVVIGGAHSNNVASLSQALIENGIKPTLMLLPGNNAAGTCAKGNALLTSLLVPKADMVFVDRENWHDIALIAEDYAYSLSAGDSRRRVVVVPEGACMPDAVAGAMTLGIDVLRNETDLPVSIFVQVACDSGRLLAVREEFDHVIMDSGTGLSAAAAVAVLEALGVSNLSVHVVMLAGSVGEFNSLLNDMVRPRVCHLMEAASLQAIGCDKHAEERVYVKCHVPTTARSFGSVNRRILDTTLRLARHEGILADPVYAAKLFNEAERICREYSLKNNVLIVHSGGGTGLFGYQASSNDAAGVAEYIAMKLGAHMLLSVNGEACAMKQCCAKATPLSIETEVQLSHHQGVASVRRSPAAALP